MSGVVVPDDFVRQPHTQLRNYPRDSSHAAARVVAAALLTNGSVKSVESAAMDALNAHALLGLAKNDWSAVISNLRQDLLHACGGEELAVSPEVASTACCET